MINEVFIVDALRTPIGGMRKSLKTVPATELASIVIKELVKRNNIKETAIDEGILGNVVSTGLGQNPARQALVRSGLLPEIPAFTVNKVCGSGLKSVILAAQAIQCGDHNMIIAGGMESASQCPHFFSGDKKADQLEKDQISDSLIKDGLWCSLTDTHMGDIAECTAEKFKISRQEQDEYALESHQKAVNAINNNLSQKEIVPVKVTSKKIFDVDEKPRKNASLKRLSRLPSVFKPDGSVTAGNSPAPADGAAAVILASGEAVKENKLKTVARIIEYASVAVEPNLVFTAPAESIKKSLKKASLSLSDIDIFEINEAFAVQAILTVRNTGLDKRKMNILGGTIALGHPLGASGARGLVTLINALETENKKRGIMSICLGGGCAVSLIVER